MIAQALTVNEIHQKENFENRCELSKQFQIRNWNLLLKTKIIYDSTQ